MKSILLFTALMTTQSGTGMVCVVALIVMVLIKNIMSGETLKHPMIAIGILAMVMGFLYVENTYGILQTKVIDQGGSYGVRMDDTIQGYTIAVHNFIFGTGICNDYSTAWHSLLSDSRSNGMANLAASAGVPFCLYYLIRLFKRTKEYAENDLVETISIFIILICIYNTQPVVIQTIGLTCLFKWRGKDNES